MPGFSDSFWSEDYSTGLTRLFSKLNQGLVENEEVVVLVKRRADAEESHGNKLQQISRDAYKKDGFNRDDGASVRRAFEGMVKETSESGKYHCKIASNLHEMVLRPFTRWTAEHASRVHTSERELMTKVKLHDAQLIEVKKLRSTYFNKCRLLEDYEEENKLAFPGPDGNSTPTKSPKKTPEEIAAEVNAVLDDEPVELGDTLYSASQMKVLLESMLDSITIKEVKLPILGTFQHVSTGSAIVEWIHKNMGVDTLEAAEGIGQDLVDEGFIRYLGVGNTFANSSVLNYQWKDKALVVAGRKKPGENSIVTRAAAMPYVGDYVQTYVSNEYANETPEEKLQREAAQSNETYRLAVKKLDGLRTDLEATSMDHLRFMERCELDRLKALKAVMMDMSAAISNVIPGMKSSMDTMLLFQESLSPLGDLKYMIESYRTGSFVPKVVTYENYYNSIDDQTFGVDIEMRSRIDGKRVPNLVSTILTYMDEFYAKAETNEQRQKVWLRLVPLHLTHQLRGSINDGKSVDKQVLEEYDPAIVASVLKLYLLELPDSLVSKTIYEPLKSIYANYATDDEAADRIPALTNILQQLRVANIATLDALTMHFARLFELTKADEAYKSALAYVLASGILRPRTGSNLTHHDRHPQRLVLDLIEHRDEIFTTLRRATTLRPRSATDEKDRRARVEERNKAIAQKQRVSSASHTPSPSATKVSTPQEDIKSRPITSNGHTRSPASSSGVQLHDQPFSPPAEESITASYMDSVTLPSDVHVVPPNVPATVQPLEPQYPTQSQLLEQTQTAPLRREGRKSSLTRSILSSHRISRHGRMESRTLTGLDTTPAQSHSHTSSMEQKDTPTHEKRYELDDAPVRGISLEDGAGDYDYD